MQMNRTKNATRNMVFGTALKLYQIILPFIMRTVMVYTLGVQYLGLNSLFTSVLQVLNLAELGVGSAMVFSMYKPIVDDDSITICALMNLYKWYYRFIGGAVLLGGLIITPFIPKLISGDVPDDINIYVLYLLNLFATVLTYWLFAFKNSILQAHQRNDVVSKVTILTDTVKYVLQIAALFILKSYYFYVVAILFTQVLANITTAIAAQHLYPQYQAKGKLPKSTVKQINQRIKDLFTAKLGTTIVNSADTIVISAFLGLTTLAVYQNYYYIMTSVVGFITVLLSSCTAGIGNSLIVDSDEKKYKDFKKFSLMEIWLVGICVCCFLNIYQPFMTIWMGEENLLSFGCVILICVYFYLYTTNHYMAIYKDAAGIWHEDRFRPLSAALANLAMNLLLVRYIGIFAIILSTVLSYVLINMPWLIHNIFKCLFKRSSREYVGKYLYYTCIIAFAALLSYLACMFFDEPSVLCIIIRLVFCLIIPNIVFLIFMGHGEDFNGALDLLDKITKNKLCFITKHLRRK